MTGFSSNSRLDRAVMETPDWELLSMAHYDEAYGDLNRSNRP